MESLLRDRLGLGSEGDDIDDLGVVPRQPGSCLARELLDARRGAGAAAQGVLELLAPGADSQVLDRVPRVDEAELPGAHALASERLADQLQVRDTSGRWFFYVWFDRGNNISSFNTAAPGTVYNHAGPAVFSTPAYEEGINEAPEVFKRNGLYYLLLSGGWYNSQYAMYYVMGDSIPQLTRARAVRRLSQPLRNTAGRLT